MIVINHNLFSMDSTIILPDKKRLKISSQVDQLAEFCVDLAYSMNDYNIAISTPNPLFKELSSHIIRIESKNYNTSKIKVTTI